VIDRTGSVVFRENAGSFAGNPSVPARGVDDVDTSVGQKSATVKVQSRGFPQPRNDCVGLHEA
jgi:hypothetical protein